MLAAWRRVKLARLYEVKAHWAILNRLPPREAPASVQMA